MKNEIEIPAKPKKAFLHLLPALILMACVGVSYSFYFRQVTPCDFIVGMHATYLAMLAFTYGAPLVFLGISLLNMPTAYKVFKYGYYPPLDSVHFRKVIAKKSTFGYVRAVFMVCLVFLALLLLYFGHSTYSTLANDRSYSEILITLNENCQQGL